MLLAAKRNSSEGLNVVQHQLKMHLSTFDFFLNFWPSLSPLSQSGKANYFVIFFSFFRLDFLS